MEVATSRTRMIPMGPGRKMIPMGPAHHALFQGKTRRPLLLARHTLDPAAPPQKSSHVIVQVILDLRTSDPLPASKNASPFVPAPRRSPHPSHPGARLGCCDSVPRSYLRKLSVLRDLPHSAFKNTSPPAGRHSLFHLQLHRRYSASPVHSFATHSR